MNNEIKVGDKVRVSKDAPKLYTNNWTVDWNNGESVAKLIDGDAAKIKQVDDNDEWFYLDIPLKYLTKVEDETKEPKFKKGDRVKYIGKEHPEYWGEIFTVDGEIFYNDYHKNMQISCIRCEKHNLCNIPLSDLEPYTESMAQTEASADVLGEFTPIPRFDNPIIGFEQAYWREYEADLAKELAIAYAKRGNSPLDAVATAKEITKRLKQSK